jgi:hypothetical protein
MKVYGNWSMMTFIFPFGVRSVHALKLVTREGRMRKEEEKRGGEGRGEEGKEFTRSQITAVA